jgi:hypothetical protein
LSGEEDVHDVGKAVLESVPWAESDIAKAATLVPFNEVLLQAVALEAADRGCAVEAVDAVLLCYQCYHDVRVVSGAAEVEEVQKELQAGGAKAAGMRRKRWEWRLQWPAAVAAELLQSSKEDRAANHESARRLFAILPLSLKAAYCNRRFAAVADALCTQQRLVALCSGDTKLQPMADLGAQRKAFTADLAYCMQEPAKEDAIGRLRTMLDTHALPTVRTAHGSAQVAGQAGLRAGGASALQGHRLVYVVSCRCGALRDAGRASPRRTPPRSTSRWRWWTRTGRATASPWASAAARCWVCGPTG